MNYHQDHLATRKIQITSEMSHKISPRRAWRALIEGVTNSHLAQHPPELSEEKKPHAVETDNTII